MATVLAARLEPPADDGSRPMRWASAGYLPPLVATGNHQARYLHTGSVGHPLGVDTALPRPDHQHTLPPGSTLLLHTDGLIESRDHGLDDGMNRTQRIAARHATQPLDELCNALLSEPDGTFYDDVALLAARLAG